MHGFLKTSPLQSKYSRLPQISLHLDVFCNSLSKVLSYNRKSHRMNAVAKLCLASHIVYQEHEIKDLCAKFYKGNKAHTERLSALIYSQLPTTCLLPALTYKNPKPLPNHPVLWTIGNLLQILYLKIQKCNLFCFTTYSVALQHSCT